MGILDGSAGEEFACNAEETENAGSVLGLRRCPRGRNGNPLQYSCLGNRTEEPGGLQTQGCSPWVAKGWT